MIIKISQTASNFKQTYDVKSDNFYYLGQTGSRHPRQPITLSNQETTFKAVFSPSKWVNYIPLRYLFDAPNLTRGFTLYRNDSRHGLFIFSKHGLYKSFYVITLESNEILHGYCRSIGSFHYISIYLGNEQIALVETYLTVRDYKYTHKLYLLEHYSNLAETLSLFVLYFANYRFAQRMHMSKGVYAEKTWSFSKYNDKYDPTWRETHFPNENFFGKTNI